MINHNSLPGLAEAVGVRLSQWRNQEQFTELTFLDESVEAIITDQDSLGWDVVIFWALHKTWSQEQGKYLSALGKRSTGTTWMSHFFRELWKLQHSMWINRNSFVHKDKTSMHKHEIEAVEKVIWKEFTIGRNGLPSEYAGLFRGNVQCILNGDSATKVQWVYKVWSGRDRIRNEQNLDAWYKDPLAASFVQRKK